MKKISIIISIAIISVFILWGLNYLNSDKSSNEQNLAEDLFLQYKDECKIFDNGIAESRIYKNELLDFSFIYPEDTLVCERTVKRYYEDNHYPEMEITLWPKTVFLNNEAGSPELVIHINNPDSILNFSQNTTSGEEIYIDGVKAYKRVQKSDLCVTKDCPEYTTISFDYLENNLEIQVWTDLQNVINSFRFEK
jgi:hypothetical protein